MSEPHTVVRDYTPVSKVIALLEVVPGVTRVVEYDRNLHGQEPWVGLHVFLKVGARYPLEIHRGQEELVFHLPDFARTVRAVRRVLAQAGREGLLTVDDVRIPHKVYEYVPRGEMRPGDQRASGHDSLVVSVEVYL